MTITSNKNSNRPTNADALVICQKSIDSTTKYFGGVTSLSMVGGVLTPVQLKAIFQDDLDATKALDASEADVVAKRSDQKAKRKLTLLTRRNLKKYIGATVTPASLQAQMLADFDYPPPKARTQTVASKAHAVAQAEATRAARGTKGPKAKAAIKGVVPEMVPAPAATPGPVTK